MEAEAKSNDAQHACTYCGVFRRQIFNQVARDVNATKLATGHNLDDETQSIVMNYLEGNVNNMVRIGYKTLSQDKRFTQKIKPLRKIPEKEIKILEYPARKWAKQKIIKQHQAGLCFFVKVVYNKIAVVVRHCLLHGCSSFYGECFQEP